MFWFELLLVIMCLHPKTDIVNSIATNARDWDITDDCDYLYQIKNVDSDDLAIIQINIRGIMSKISLLKNLIDNSIADRCPDVIIVSETWLTPTLPSVKIPGYKFVHKCRQDRKGGGMGILVSDNLRFSELNTLTSDVRENEVVTIELTLRTGKRCIVSSMYRAPNTSSLVFQCCYNSLVCALKKTKPYAIIIGLDHNLDFLKSIHHGSTNDFIHSNLDMGLVPTITKPTRITKSSATLIDNIIVSENLCGNFCSNILINDMSDHMPTICVVESLKSAKKNNIIITSRDTRPKNIAALKDHLQSYDWPALLNNTSLDRNMETLDNIVQTEMNYCTPVKSRKISYRKLRKEPWLMPNLRMCTEKSKQLYCKSLKPCCSPSDLSKYQAYNRCLRRAIRTAKRLYHYNKCYEYRNDTKKLWKVINEIIGKNSDKSGTIDYLKIDSIKEYGAKRISNSLANYFSNVGRQFAEKIPKPRKSIDLYLKKLQSNHKSLYLDPCDATEVKELINMLPLKNSHGHDNISNIMLKTIVNEIAVPLVMLINQSMSQGQFPTMMKLAKVVPLFKSKDRSIETNYRPISLLTTMSKILEKVVYTRVYKFLTVTGQISDKQYGFRAKHSCEHAVRQLVGTVLKNLENNKITVSVLLDLSKAFDTIEHQIMLKKLELYGVRGTPLNWFDSYLSG